MMKKIQKLLRQREDEGQGLVEYGLILGLIAVVAIAALNATGTNVNAMLQRVANTLDTVS
jgi:pilus assembly protein Flp/PilA